MQKVSEVALGMVGDRALLSTILKELPEKSETKQLLARRKRAATDIEVGKAIALCESLAQVKPLAMPQRKALQIELLRLGWTREKLEQRARSVALNREREWGNIGLRYWLEERVLTPDNLDFMVALRVRNILAEIGLRVKHPEAKEVGHAALARLEFEYEEEFRKVYNATLDRMREEKKKELATWRKKIYGMTRSQKVKVYERAVKAGIFHRSKDGKPDEAIIGNMGISYIVEKLLPILKGVKTW